MGLCAFESTQQADTCIGRLMLDDVVLRVRTVDIEEGARIAGKVRSLSGSWRRYLIQTYRHNVASSFLLLASADTACHVLLFPPPGADQGLLVRVLGRCDVRRVLPVPARGPVGEAGTHPTGLPQEPAAGETVVDMTRHNRNEGTHVSTAETDNASTYRVDMGQEALNQHDPR